MSAGTYDDDEYTRFFIAHDYFIFFDAFLISAHIVMAAPFSRRHADTPFRAHLPANSHDRRARALLLAGTRRSRRCILSLGRHAATRAAMAGARKMPSWRDDSVASERVYSSPRFRHYREIGPMHAARHAREMPPSAERDDNAQRRPSIVSFLTVILRQAADTIIPFIPFAQAG